MLHWKVNYILASIHIWQKALLNNNIGYKQSIAKEKTLGSPLANLCFETILQN